MANGINQRETAEELLRRLFRPQGQIESSQRQGTTSLLEGGQRGILSPEEIAGTLSPLVTRDNDNGITERVRGKVADRIGRELGEKAVEALSVRSPVEILSQLNRMLPPGQEAVPGPGGGIVFGQSTTRQEPTPPARTPGAEARSIPSREQTGAQAGTQTGAQTARTGQTPQTGQAQPPETNRLLLALGSAVTTAFGGDPSPLINLAESREQRRFETLNEAAKQRGRIDLERFKQDRLDQRERLKARLEEQGVDENTVERQVVAQDLSDTIKAFDKLGFLRGPIGGNVRRLLSAVNPLGDKNLAEAEAASDILVFSLGQFATNQAGRAFSDRDRELIENAFKFRVDDKTGTFEGKLQSAINIINSRVKAARRSGINPDAKELPDAKVMIRRTRGGLNPFGETQETIAGSVQAGGTREVQTTSQGTRFKVVG